MKNKNRMIVPKLRFREFQNCSTWEAVPLNVLLYESKKRNRDLFYDKSDVLSVSGDFGCVNQIELLGRSYAGVSVKDYHVVEHGDIVYTKSPLKKNPYGIIKENQGVAGIVSTLYAVYKTTPFGNSSYINQYFSRDYNVNSYLQPIVRKGAKNDMKVNNSAVLVGKVPITDLKEQQKIADCLTSLDDLITAESKKLELLKDHKKGLMQKLFPAEGKTMPEWRFPEFLSDKVWKAEQIEQITENVVAGGTPSTTEDDYWNGSIRWMSSGELNLKVVYEVSGRITELGLKKSSTKCIPALCVLIGLAGQGKTRGTAAINMVELCINQSIAAIYPNPGLFNSFFLYHCLDNKYDELRKISSGDGGRGGMNLKMIKTLNISFPSIPEQEKIANTLSSIDNLISGQSKRIEQLKEHKKGLVQGLFPSLEEVD